MNKSHMFSLLQSFDINKKKSDLFSDLAQQEPFPTWAFPPPVPTAGIQGIGLTGNKKK